MKKMMMQYNYLKSFLNMSLLVLKFIEFITQLSEAFWGVAYGEKSNKYI